MTPSFWILLAPLFAGALVTLRAALRDRDPRHGVSFAFLGLLAARHVVSPPPTLPSIDAALEAEAAPLLVAMAINLGAWLAASLTANSIHERNRAEELQWSSMEALRKLAEQLQASSAPLAASSGARDNANQLLRYGCEHLQFETGLLLQRTGSLIEILAAQAPDDVSSLEPGPCPALAESLASRCFESRDVVIVEDASLGSGASDPSDAPFAWQSLAGLRILESSESTLSIVFADRTPRADRLGAVEKSLLTVMGRWLEERADADRARAQLETQAAKPIDKPIDPPVDTQPQTRTSTEATQPSTNTALAPEAEADKPLTPAHARPGAAASAKGDERKAEGVDLNRGIREIETQLRKSLGSTHNVQVALAPRTPRVEFDMRTLERIATSLLLHAADTVPDDEDLDLSTGAIEAPEPGIPGFGTLSVRARGLALDTNQLGALYEGRGDVDLHLAKRRLPLTRVVRLLRDAGGDLSLESEEGVGTTLTAFLPACPDAKGDNNG